MAEEIGLFADPPDDSHTHEVSAVEPAKAPQLVFGSAEKFLHEQLLPTYVRDVDDRSAKWCMEWYFHPEAVVPCGSSVEGVRAPAPRRRHRDQRVVARPRRPPHARPTGPQGPFYNCDKSGHRDPAHLKPKRAPARWFRDVRAQK
jgi:hypothetical protein